LDQSNPPNIWHWYYNTEREELYHINGSTIKYFKREMGWQRTHCKTTFELKCTKPSAQTCPTGVPTSVINISDYRVNKLQEGPPPLTAKEDPTSFWTFIATWGGNWMWRDIVNGNKSKDDMQWVAEGMTAGTLIWTTDGSYNRKQAADLLGAGWIIFCKATGQQITGLFWE
jgi:hypothetical protein